jgi:hypothetical protein
MTTPRKKLDAEVEAIAAKYGLTAHEAIHVGRRAKRMIVRFEIYAHVVAHYGNIAAAARYLGKDKTTVLNGINKRKGQAQCQMEE